MDPESSFELIERAQRGDASALDRLLARYRPRLQRWASGRLPRYAREVTDTEDLVQNALIGTFKNFHAFENRTEWALQAYLRTAVTNGIRDVMSAVGSRPRVEELGEHVEASGLSPFEAAVGAEVFGRYDRALATLDRIDREAVISRVELGCSYKEIAALLGKPSPDAARMTVARALAELAKAMSA
jgi:RNA polymerase sigma-70 factor (ECF subfamily)